jgi:hypothetical protein
MTIRNAPFAKTALTALLIFLACLTGCARHQHQFYNPNQGALVYTMPVSLTTRLFDYEAPTPQPEWYEVPARQVDGYYVRGMRFPSIGQNGQPDNAVDARYYQSMQSSSQAKPLLIVLPIWGTHTFPATILSNGYTVHSQGQANVLWMSGDEPLFDWFSLPGHKNEADFIAEVDVSMERFRSVAIDIRRLIDWAETRPEIDSSRIGIIGFSMSAIVAANVAGTDPRIHTAVYVLGAAEVWDVMAECDLVVAYMRNGVKKNLGWSQEQYREFFREKFRDGDPSLWQGAYRPENTLLIEGSQDACVPPNSRDALWQVTGQPERIIYPYNHWQPFLAMTPVGAKALTNDIFEFLDRKLLNATLPGKETVDGLFCEVGSPKTFENKASQGTDVSL